MRPIAALLAPLAPIALLAACVTVPAADRTPPAPPGTAVALGQRVQVGDAIVTPLAVVEDSRCPIAVRCIWAGRLVVKTRWQIAGWQEVIAMELGANYERHGRGVALASAEPGKSAARTTRPDEYRFVYGRAWYVGTEAGTPPSNGA